MGGLPVFVYGTLRRGERNAGLLDAVAAGRRPARLDDHALYAGPEQGLPYAVPEPGGIVVGELVTIGPDRHDDVLEALDRLEGHRPDHGPYRRVARSIRRLDGDAERTTRAWVYLAEASVADRLGEALRVAGGDWAARA